MPYPTRMFITATDWAAGSPFDTPGQPARGRRGQPGYRAAVDAQPGPAALRFLALATVPYLEWKGDAAPWRTLVRLVGAFGSCLTTAARRDEMAPIHVLAAPLAASMRRRYRDGTDGLLARNLKDFMQGVSLPATLVAPSISEPQLTDELMDSLTYLEGGGRWPPPCSRRDFICSSTSEHAGEATPRARRPARECATARASPFLPPLTWKRLCLPTGGKRLRPSRRRSRFVALPTRSG